MATISAACPGCAQSYPVDASLVGRKVRCNRCGHRFVLHAAPRDHDPSSDGASPILLEPAPSPMPVPVRIGRFRIEECLGSGTFGSAYRAHDPMLDRRVSLKVTRREFQQDPKAVERFLRMARDAARLSHPHIAAVFEAGEDDGVCYVASAYVAGRPLSDVIADGPLDPRRAARIVAGLAEALDHGHRQRIVHRDLKPSNVLLDADDRPHLLDFGLAQFAGSGEKLTHLGTRLGNPAYLAPEQAGLHGNEPGGAGDQYSLGVILYELLSGRVPFTGPLETVITRTLRDRPASLCTSRPEIPADLEAICLKALAKRPGDRYPDCHALAEDLERWLAGRPIVAEAAPSAPIGTNPPAMPGTTPSDAGARWDESRPAIGTLALHSGGTTLGFTARAGAWAAGVSLIGIALTIGLAVVLSGSRPRSTIDPVKPAAGPELVSNEPVPQPTGSTASPSRETTRQTLPGEGPAPGDSSRAIGAPSQRPALAPPERRRPDTPTKIEPPRAAPAPEGAAEMATAYSIRDLEPSGAYLALKAPEDQVKEGAGRLRKKYPDYQRAVKQLAAVEAYWSEVLQLRSLVEHERDVVGTMLRDNLQARSQDDVREFEAMLKDRLVKLERGDLNPDGTDIPRGLSHQPHYQAMVRAGRAKTQEGSLADRLAALNAMLADFPTPAYINKMRGSRRHELSRRRGDIARSTAELVALAHRIEAAHRALASEPEVVAMLERANRVGKRPIKLGPSDDFLRDLKYLRTVSKAMVSEKKDAETGPSDSSAPGKNGPTFEDLDLRGRNLVLRQEDEVLSSARRASRLAKEFRAALARYRDDENQRAEALKARAELVPRRDSTRASLQDYWKHTSEVDAAAARVISEMIANATPQDLARWNPNARPGSSNLNGSQLFNQEVQARLRAEGLIDNISVIADVTGASTMWKLMAELSEIEGQLANLPTPERMQVQRAGSARRLRDQRDRFAEAVAEACRLVDWTEGGYKTLAADPEVKKRLDEFNRGREKHVWLAPSDPYRSIVKELPDLEAYLKSIKDLPELTEATSEKPVAAPRVDSTNKPSAQRRR